MKQGRYKIMNVSSTDLEENQRYDGLCAKVKLSPDKCLAPIEYFHQSDFMASQDETTRLSVALLILLRHFIIKKETTINIDRECLDQTIVTIDACMIQLINSIIHQSTFQQLESKWQSLAFLVHQKSRHGNIKINVLDVNKACLQEDFVLRHDIKNSSLHKIIYKEEYDTPGGEPYAAMISDFEFTAEVNDVVLLSNISQLAALVHCPFLANVALSFF